MSSSPESDPFNSIEQNLAQLNDALYDPHIAAVIEAASEMNKVLKTESTTPKEALDIIKDLNRKWGSLYGSIVTVSGNVSFLSPKNQVETKYYEDIEMLSSGFVISGSTQNDDYVTGRNIALSLQMDIPEDLLAEYSETTEGTVLVGYAELSQVSIEAHGFSAERAKAWLWQFAPDVIDEIDNLILSSDSEEDALIALQSFDLSKANSINLDGDKTFEAISGYVRSMIEVEQKLPYLMSISGDIIVKDKDGDDAYARISPKSRIVFIHDLSIISTIEPESLKGGILNKKSEIYLTTTILGDTKKENDLQAKIPLDSIVSIQSGRPILLQQKEQG